MDESTVTAYRRQAVRFWERARVLYLALLTAVTCITFLLSANAGPISTRGFFHDLDAIFVWTFCFIGANVCYSVVYMLEFLFMGTFLQPFYRSIRWVLFAVGSLFAMALAFVTSYSMFWAMRGGI